ncbi:MAG: putative Ig domain-containing protein [Clostridiales bacterium]|jgi:beta-glucosidase|nr:putative Ig domain-containing protein [Clostridiales bacterium]
MKKFFKKRYAKLISLALILGLAFGVFAGGWTAVYADDGDDETTNYYYADYATRAEALTAGNALNEEIMAEGITLLKNEGGALPLATSPSNAKKISVFGKNSTNIVYGGQGSGAGSSSGRVNLQTALQGAGYEINGTLTNFYNNTSQSGSNRAALTGYSILTGWPTYETPIASYTQAVKDSYAAYGDAALIVISRMGGESTDLPRTMWWNGSNYTSYNTAAVSRQAVNGARDANDHYMQLDANETALINHVCENFDNVIVVLNTGSQFECGFLDDPGHYAYNAKINGALWIGYPGTRGLNALGKVLNGTVNPSGKTVDTYSRDFKADPTWQNFSNNLVDNGHKYSNSPGGQAQYFIRYEEGVYMGYRYYETRGYTEGFGSPYSGAVSGSSTSSWADWYGANVVYPFGYGLSYTSFDWTVGTASPASGEALGADDVISVPVTVKNTGSKAGKEVVELYYTAPYTAGGIEKPYVVLGAFEKTGLLAPQESETVTLTIKARDMASYDWDDANGNDFKGYELDAGGYSVKIMRDAHTVEGAAVAYTVPAGGFQYDTDETTGADIENLFDDASNGITAYMSREDFAGTFPQMSTGTDEMTVSQETRDKLREWLVTGQGGAGNVADKPSDPWYVAPEDMPTTGAFNNIRLADLVGLDYDDPLWDDYLDQFDVGTSAANSGMVWLVSYGGWMSGAISKVGLPFALNGDGPSGWANGRGVATDQVAYASDTILASTYNKELAYRKGNAIGNEGLFGDGSAGNNSKYPGWYAPAVNIHRSAFSGRNFEYFSEDGYLTGAIAARVVAGAKEKGVFSFVKHFGLNDQETHRDGLATWANEQSMREIYFKGFELCVKDGGANGIMTGLNRIGAVWAGGNYNLLTRLLRDEWGFHGSVVSDYIEGRGGYGSMNQAIRAGGDLMLASGNRYVDFALDSATTVTALRNATHNITYAVANSCAMNGDAPLEAMGAYENRQLPMGTVGSAYSADLGTVTLNNGDDPAKITYAVKDGSVLPGGLALSAAGLLTGTAAEEVSNYKFTVVASYETFRKEATFTVTIVDPLGSIVYGRDGGVLDTATVGEAYTADVGGAEVFKTNPAPGEVFPTITYALKSGSLLPEGLSLSADGGITGTPTKNCIDYEFTVVASALGLKNVEASLTLSILHSMTFSGKTLAAGKFGAPYLDKVAPADNSDPDGGAVTYRLKEGSALPGGLTLTANGTIAGTPTETVTDRVFTVVATADFATAQEAQYSVTVGLAFNRVELPDGKNGRAYDATVDMAQGADGIVYGVKEGSALPEGLTLSAAGELTGTPTKAGVYTFTITANKDGLVGDETAVRLYIANADPVTGGNETNPPPAPTTPAPKGCGNVISSVIVGGSGALILVSAALFVYAAARKKNKAKGVAA